MTTTNRIFLIVIIVTFLTGIVYREENYLFLGIFLFLIFIINNYEVMEDEDEDDEPPTQFSTI